MTRVEELSVGRLGELLVEDALNHDPARDLVRVRVGVLAEVVRRVVERQRRKEAGTR